jgi:hypothetical protein
VRAIGVMAKRAYAQRKLDLDTAQTAVQQVSLSRRSRSADRSEREPSRRPVPHLKVARPAERRLPNAATPLAAPRADFRR